MKDNTNPPDVKAEPDIGFETDSTNEVSVDANGHGTPTETYRAVHDWSENQLLSTTVVLAVGEVLGTSRTELPPFHKYVDPDGIDRIFAPIQSDQVRTEGQVSFPYAGVRVMVQADGTIILSMAPEEET